MPPVYDPRLNAAVTLHVNEKVPLGARTEETPLKSFLVGPHTTGPVKRPVTAPVGRGGQEVDPKPSFLAADGKWGVDLSLLAPIKSPKSPYSSQSMWSPGNSPTGTMATRGATATWTRGSRAIRPVSSVYTYADRSPVAIGDHVAEVGSIYRQQLGSKPGSRQNSRPASTGHVRPGSRGAQQQQLNGTKRPAEAPATVHFGSTDAAVQVGEGEVTRRPSTAPLATAAAAAAWGLGAATAHITAASRAPSVSPYTTEQLMIEDLVRDGPNLGRVCVPGSPNARLVGGRWRFVSNPVDGDSVYTDYYGRYGPDRCNYYGRAYNIDTTQFAKNRLVGDTDYMRVQASMPGISTLRSRPGLVLRATVNNGATDKLSDLPGANSYGVHKISDFYNIAESEANLYA